MCEVREISSKVFDAFWDKGWENWARIRNNNGFLKQISGEHIPKAVFAELISRFSTKTKEEVNGA
jgi:hypothetical protein